MKCCDDAGALRDENARLEGEKAALASELVSCKVFLCAPATKADRNAKIRSIDAALSGDGKGWLPPDKVKEVREFILSLRQDGEHFDEWCEQMPECSPGCKRATAALAVLRGE